MKVYIKKGLKNYKENKLVKKIEEAVAKKIEQNPEFVNEFRPATNFSELQSLHDKYCIEDVSFEEIPEKEIQIEQTSTYQQHQEFRDSAKQIMEKETKEVTKNSFDDNDTFIDPLNREEPIVRDYVMNDEFKDTTTPKGPAKTFFDEPTSFKDSFEIPDDNGQTTQGSSTNNPPKPKKDKPIQEPVNPNWDEMNGGKKKKSTRKFAKYIVEVVCMLSEKGFVWYANKDINDAKLAEYELNNEMDLGLLVTLEEGQQMTVKQFFQTQCLRAEQLAKIDPEEKQDLADALAEVLLEKGVGPTPTQELLLISVKIFGGQIANLLVLKSQTNALLAQLRSMNEGTQQYKQTYTPPSPPQPEPVQEQKYQEPALVQSVDEIDEDKEMQFEQLPKIKEDNDLGIIEKEIETKE